MTHNNLSQFVVQGEPKSPIAKHVALSSFSIIPLKIASDSQRLGDLVQCFCMLQLLLISCSLPLEDLVCLLPINIFSVYIFDGYCGFSYC